MQTKTVLKEKMQFIGQADEHEVLMDAKSPLGSGKGLTPKELVALAISGCTAMDVAALMRKYKQTIDKFEVTADVQMSEGVLPVVFKSVQLTFDLHGQLDKQKVLEAVKLSQTKYCGVSAMFVKAAPITYKVQLNGELIGEGHAEF